MLIPVIKKSPDAWLQEPEFKGMFIMDPDGWDRSNYAASWAEEITRDEFLSRAACSTTMWPKGWKFV
jgi:hypothetical protein